jgi:hypothetical protein
VLHDWETFYFLMGSAGAGLIGLLFVVITLTAGFDRAATFRGARLYLTPTAVHFAIVLTISAIAIAPGLPASVVGTMFAAVAVVGLALAIRSSIGIRTPPPPGIEAPHWTDFWMYGVLPAAIYLGILAAAVVLVSEVPLAAAAMAALLLILLLTAIRNAWDLVVWIAPLRKDAAP